VVESACARIGAEAEPAQPAGPGCEHGRPRRRERGGRRRRRRLLASLASGVRSPGEPHSPGV